ncbi:MAG: DNA translocase FtsK [Coriobacteriia bacterium]|nr:DNA translocase FtsK [Coriobacteriia bacterium]
MANKASSNNAARSRGKAAASPRQKSQQKGRNPKPQASSATSEGLLRSNAKRDIASIVMVCIGVVLMVMVVIPSDALVTSAVCTGMKMAVGVAAYIFPLVLIVSGVCLLFKIEQEQMPLRVALGLLLVFIAVTGLISLFSPGAAEDPASVLSQASVTEFGGYVGAGIAFAGLSLFGQIVSCILLVALAAIGVVIIGFSISGFLEKVRQKREAYLAGEQMSKFSSRRKGASGNVDPDPNLNNPADAAPYRAVGTMSLSGGHEAQTRRLAQPANQVQASPRNATGRLSAAETMALAGSEQQLTRKLGRPKAEEPAAEPEPKKAAAKKKVPVTPVSAPRPDEDFELPSSALLNRSGKTGKRVSQTEFENMGAALQETLEDFGVMAQVVGYVAGPTVTLFKVSLPAGVRVSRVTALNDDIALALAAPGVRIFAPIPGTNYVGIEVPNRSRQNVLLGDVLDSAPAGPLQIAIGKDVEGNCIVSDLAKMPHLLIGGTTGSGKSVSINAMIMSILMRATPSEVRFIMIDPKRVEFTPYNGIPHLYVPVVTEPKEASSALAWGVAEMERRLKVFSKVGARNIGQYNAKVQSGELEEQEGETPLELPYIVIIIDELADLMMNVGKEVEFSISRIAQLARAAGIHLIVATQRPSANVVTGLIKANITNRIAFNVASSIDSRVVLDTPGAENLIGLGDLLLSKPELSKPQRIQGCYVSEEEIFAVVSRWKEQGEPEYHSEILKTNTITLGDSSPDGSGGGSTSDDPLVWEAADIVVSSGLGSTSNIQRRLKVGYARAGRIMDMLEEKGVVGPANGSKPRDVLIDALELESLKAFETQD